MKFQLMKKIIGIPKDAESHVLVIVKNFFQIMVTASILAFLITGCAIIYILIVDGASFEWEQLLNSKADIWIRYLLNIYKLFGVLWVFNVIVYVFNLALGPRS